MPAPSGLLRFVNILQGTYSHFGFSTGNTLPLVAMPFGMNHWSLQTAEGRWFFSPHDRKLQGIRCTHQPSPWMADYGALTIFAQVGTKRYPAGRRSESYRLDQSLLSPHALETTLLGTGVKIEMAPTERAAIFRFTFPAGRTGRVILDPAAGESFVSLQPDGRTVVGFTRGNSGGVPEGYAMYFVARFDQPVVAASTFDQAAAYEGETEGTGERRGFVAEFATDVPTVHLRIATSFISLEQAERNLTLELADAPFETISDRAEAAWERALGQIEVSDDDETAVRTFYSCLYRTQLFPRIWHEPAADGGVHHRSPYDGQVHPGVLYTDNGFWDTYRTEYPLLALLMPDRVAEICQGWVNAYKEGGWFPQWATPGYRACMVGTHIDAVLADAVTRGVTQFDVAAALEGVLKHADTVGDPDGAWGRIGIEDYQRLGYVSTDHHESVARSLDYAYDDWCIAQIARALGNTADAERLEARSQNYRHLWDPEVGFMRGRHANGAWRTPWDEFGWGDPYVEGGPWQSSWAVPHDVPGLIGLNGGADAFVAKLDRMLSTPPHFTVGTYGFEIHEMTEMACADFGQYAHSNQPVHHALYLYTAAGRPDRTQFWVRRVMEEMYTPDKFPGDEDNGEMAAWYVLSALGIFPACPGDGTWTLGSPRFRHATVHLPAGDLVIEAPENSDTHVYVHSATLNETPIPHQLPHTTLAQGGVMRFEMGGDRG